MGDGGGVEPGFAGEAEVFGGGVVGEGIRGCAEWAVSFSGHLERGTTTVKVGRKRKLSTGIARGQFVNICRHNDLREW